MLYNKTNLKAAKIAAQDETRPVLSGVYFTGHSTVATDSYKLIEIDCPATINEVTEQKEGPSFVLSAVDCGRIAKMFPRRKSVSKNFNATPNHNTVTIKPSDTTLNWIRAPEKQEGTYPDYKRVFRTTDPRLEVTVGPKLLIELLKQFEGPVTLKFVAATDQGIDKLKPILLEGEASEGQKARGLLMPVRK